MRDLTLPSFAMDCRLWLVIMPEDAGMLDEVDGAPILAVLSTAVIGHDSFRPASGVLTVGLLDEDVAVSARALGGETPAAELIDADESDCLRFVLPVPGGGLALLAEFNLPDGPDPEVIDRVNSLMRSFRWAA